MRWVGVIAIVGGICPVAIAQPFQPQPPLLLAQQFECRQVVIEGGAPIFATLPQRPTTPSDFLQKGTRVSVDLTVSPIQAGDGRAYRFVTYPFGGQNTRAVYMPTQFVDRNGVFTGTLGNCRRKVMW